MIENIEGYGADRTIFWPTILVAGRQRDPRWRGSPWGVPGLFVGEHYFLPRQTAHGTLFTQGDHLHGALLSLFDQGSWCQPSRQ